MNKLMTIIKAIAFFVLPIRWYKKIWPSNLYFLNPLYNHQKYKYRLCGCASGLKVKWCCGKHKYVPKDQCEQLSKGIAMWEGRNV